MPTRLRRRRHFIPTPVYRLNIDNDGDCLTDIAISYVFSQPVNGRQTANVFVAKGAEAHSPEAVGTKVIADAEVSFTTKPNIVKAGGYTFFAGNRSDAFFFDFDGIKNLFDTKGGRNFTAPHLGGKSPWTGIDSNLESNVFSTVIELPTRRTRRQPHHSHMGQMQRAPRRQVCSMWIAQGIPQSAASLIRMRPRRSITPASR